MIAQQVTCYATAAKMDLCCTLNEGIFIFKEKIGKKKHFPKEATNFVN